MPLGPYKDFAACVVAQQNKGHSAESARKICGEIEKRTKESKGEVTEEDVKTIAAQMWFNDSVLRTTKKDNQ